MTSPDYTFSILKVVTAYGLNQLGIDNNMWPLFVTEMHTNPGRLNCANFDTQATEPVLRNHAIRKTLLHGYDKFRPRPHVSGYF